MIDIQPIPLEDFPEDLKGQYSSAAIPLTHLYIVKTYSVAPSYQCQDRILVRGIGSISGMPLWSVFENGVHKFLLDEEAFGLLLHNRDLLPEFFLSSFNDERELAKRYYAGEH